MTTATSKAAKRKPKPEPTASIAHRQYGVNDDHAPWCREVVNFDDRQDSVLALNGVVVGQFWRNIHVGHVERVSEIRLAGMGTHTAHYESIILLEEGKEIVGMFDISGQALWSLVDHWEQVEFVGEEWVRVEPQPFIWDNRGDPREQRQNGTYRSEDAWVSRVKHRRPVGKPMSWEGRSGTSCDLYENGVLTCDGIVVATFRGWTKQGPYKAMTEQYPFTRPKSASMRKVLPAALAGRSTI